MNESPSLSNRMRVIHNVVNPLHSYTSCQPSPLLHNVVSPQSADWQRCVGPLIFIGHFPQKSPIIRGFFAERDLQLKAFCASSPPCAQCCKPSPLQLLIPLHSTRGVPPNSIRLIHTYFSLSLTRTHTHTHAHLKTLSLSLIHTHTL